MKKKFNWHRVNRYSIRKLSIGVVSAAVGMSLIGVPLTETIAHAQASSTQQQTFEIDYVYVNYNDLTDLEKQKLIPKEEFVKEIATDNNAYMLVYRPKQQAKALPQTGEISASHSEAILWGTLGVSALLLVFGKKDKKNIVRVIAVLSAGSLLSATNTTAFENDIRRFLHETHFVGANNSLPTPPECIGNLAFEGYLYLGKKQADTPKQNDTVTKPANHDTTDVSLPQTEPI
ncbi:MAG: YSIRK-type signal peptide-containing protein, partial [Aerococcaceae bacterium]|nr:YSIRK-type signal peptide-containing protein [Aerococcaceae bacterium]